MTNINTDLVEMILKLNNRIISFSEKNIFNDTVLTPTQFNILGVVINEKGIIVNSLKDFLVTSAPAVSQILNRMEKSGLIKREIGKDRREMFIKPTKKAVELYNEVNAKYITITEEKLLILDEKKKIELLTRITKLQYQYN